MRFHKAGLQKHLDEEGHSGLRKDPYCIERSGYIQEERIGKAVSASEKTGNHHRTDAGFRLHILCAGLAGKIETRLSDGLEKVAPGEADCVIIAGMGGPLMERILQGRLADFGHFVLSPQSEIPHFRRFLLAEGMLIDEETMLIDEGKYYVILNVSRRAGTREASKDAVRHIVPGKMNAADAGAEAKTGTGTVHSEAAPADPMYVTEEDFLYGGRLLHRLDPVLKSFLEKEKTRYEGILRQTDSDEVRTAYQHCMNALEAYR